MKPYVVVGRSVSINAGLIRLSESQAKTRLHHLQVTEEQGVYQVLKTIHFIKGELFEANIKVSPVQALSLLDPADIEPVQPAEVEEADEDDAEEIEEELVLETVSDLAAELNLNIGETLTLLKDKYDIKLTKGSDELPEGLVEQLINDGVINAEVEESE